MFLGEGDRADMTENVELVEFAEAVFMRRRVLAPVIEVYRLERVERVVASAIADAAGCSRRRYQFEGAWVVDDDRRHVVADVTKAVGPQRAYDIAKETLLLILCGGHGEDFAGRPARRDFFCTGRKSQSGGRGRGCANGVQMK